MQWAPRSKYELCVHVGISATGLLSHTALKKQVCVNAHRTTSPTEIHQHRQHAHPCRCPTTFHKTLLPIVMKVKPCTDEWRTHLQLAGGHHVTSNSHPHTQPPAAHPPTSPPSVPPCSAHPPPPHTHTCSQCIYANTRGVPVLVVSWLMCNNMIACLHVQCISANNPPVPCRPPPGVPATPPGALPQTRQT